jgi:hypothetical protein
MTSLAWSPTYTLQLAAALHPCPSESRRAPSGPNRSGSCVRRKNAHGLASASSKRAWEGERFDILASRAGQRQFRLMSSPETPLRARFLARHARNGPIARAAWPRQRLPAWDATMAGESNPHSGKDSGPPLLGPRSGKDSGPALWGPTLGARTRDPRPPGPCSGPRLRASRRAALGSEAGPRPNRALGPTCRYWDVNPV